MTDTIRDAIILVAGTGSRLAPLTDTTHKALLEVGGRPLLDRLLDQLARQGLERVVLATGYLGDQLREAAGGRFDLEVAFAHNPDYGSTNNAESLRLAMPEVDGRPFLLCDGDILVRQMDWVEPMVAAPSDSQLAVLVHDAIAAEEMKVVLGGSDEEPNDERPVSRLSKQIPPEEAHAESIGVQTVGAPAVEPLKERLARMSDAERADAYYEDIFAELVDAGAAEFGIHPIPGGHWTEIDTPEDLKRARQLAEGWGRREV